MACKSSEEGGYDANFIEDVPEFLQCIICHLALKRPVLVIECGHKFCEYCFNTLKEFANAGALELCCPLDREVIDVIKVFKATERLVFDLKVNCDNIEKGCIWTGDLRCLKIFSDKATERLVFDLKVNCDNIEKGCIWTGDLRSLRIHTNVECNYEFDTCDVAGCTVQMERLQLKEHKLSCPKKVNNSQLLQLVTNIQNEMKEYKACNSKVVKLENDFQKQKTELELCRKELDSMKAKFELLSYQPLIYIWKMKNYSSLKATASPAVFSPMFYTSLNGYQVRLAAEWVGPKKGKFGLFLHIEAENQYELEWPFKKKTYFECVDKFGNKHTENVEVSLRREQNWGLDDFLLMPKLGHCIKNDCLEIKCWFEDIDSDDC